MSITTARRRSSRARRNRESIKGSPRFVLRDSILAKPIAPARLQASRDTLFRFAGSRPDAATDRCWYSTRANLGMAKKQGPSAGQDSRFPNPICRWQIGRHRSKSGTLAIKCRRCEMPFPGASAVVPNRVLSLPTHRIRWSGLSARYLENSSSGSPNPATRLAIFTASAGLTQAYSDQAESARRTDHFSQAASSSRRHPAKNSAKRTVGRWIVRDLRLCEVANGSCD